MKTLKIFLILCISMSSFSQKLKYRIEHIGAENGLSQGSVYSMYKDLEGNMWFGTMDGLNFWDGQKMKVYYPSKNNKFTIDGIEIKKIIGYQENIILIGTENCLNVFDRNTEKFKKIYFRNKEGIVEKNEVFPLSVLGEELTLWVSKVGLLTYNFITKKQKILVSEEKYTTDYFSNVNTTQNDQGKNVWIHAEDGLLRYNLESEKISYFFSKNKQNLVGKPEEIVKIHIKNNFVWIGTFDGVIRLDTKNFAIKRWNKFKENKEIGHIFDISSDRKGNIWLGTEKNGLLFFDVQNETFEQISAKSNFSNFKLHNDEVSFVFVDNDGIVWANTDPYGIDKIQILPGNFGTYRLNLEGKLPESMQNFSIRTILQDGDALWLGTQQSGIWKVNASDLSIVKGFYNLNTKILPSNTIRYTHKDKNGTIWVGTSEGLAYLENGRFKEVLGKKSKMSLNFIRVIEEYGNNLWVGTESGIFKVNKKSHLQELSSVFQEKRVSMIRFLSNKRLLIGVYNDGLYELNTQDDFKTYSTKKIFDSCIPIVMKTIGNFAWIGTSKGLVRLDIEKGSLKWYKREEGLPSEFIYAIEVDEKNKLWLSTNKGIVKFDPEAAVFHTFNMNDGLQGFEFNGYSSYRDSLSGVMYFGGISGMNYFKPNEINLPSKIENNILKNSLKSLEPTDYQVFLDKKLAFTRPEIKKSEFSNSFHRLNGPLPNFLYTDANGWVKFDLSNESNQKWYLEVENTRLSEVEIWIFEKSKEIYYAKTGDNLPFEKYLLKDPNPTFELNLIENQQYEIYLKANTSRDLKLPIKIWNESAISEHQSNRKFVWGIFIGFIILISFYNLFLWITIKDQTYLYYMIYILSFGLFQFSIYGFAFQYFWSNHPFNQYAFLMFLYLSYIFITLFTEKFLDLDQKLRNWKAMKILILISSIGLLIITPFWHPNQINYFAIALSLMFSFLYYLICYVYIKARNPLIFYYALAIFFLTSASTILALQNLGIISSLNQEYVLMTGSMIEIVLFSLALGYKFRQNLLEKERQQLLRNQISGDLHDDLAASLSSLTMYAELSKRRVKEDIELTDRLQTIAEKSRGILAKVRNAVYELNPSNDQEDGWLERIIDFGREIFESKNIDFKADINENFDSISLNPASRRELMYLFKEAMNNSAKYSNADSVLFSAIKKNGHRFMSLKDNGLGFESSLVKKGNGLDNMRKRAEKLGAGLEIISSPDSGTEIKIRL
ncbi:hypothetical protein EGI22_20410 [Lacihabitans sp. LS3-19]|uniref:sensor histidine kinase n=1 Tax=Lacihabitans sp. LS3-19 TaxID=2487335 RepID=UPI0020CDE351|nr:7TM diverse intracellular signaling domain-containing protein [Lacihabitans sp. LS3-19]MCP9770275.1 hypothetical protein [Lacihabitans sp. LS3-19]